MQFKNYEDGVLSKPISRFASNNAFWCMNIIHELHHNGPILLYLVLLVHMYPAGLFGTTIVT